jgi:hypothetical protein
MNEPANGEVRDIVLAAGGVALMVFGAGLLLGHSGIRRLLKAQGIPLLSQLQESAQAGEGGVMPDFERYVKIRSM